jgi:hypothetical protein
MENCATNQNSDAKVFLRKYREQEEIFRVTLAGRNIVAFEYGLILTIQV